MQWYVRRGGEVSGPMTDEALRGLAARGEIDRETFLWRPGDTSWQKAFEVPGVITPPALSQSPSGTTAAPASPALEKFAPPPASPPPPQKGDAVPTILARPWPRYWARMLDVFLFLLLVAIPVAALFPVFYANVTHVADGQLLYLLGLPFAMVLDAIVYLLCGNTPGKWLGGIRVLDVNGRKVGFTQYLKRDFMVYFLALGFGIGLVALFTLISSHKKSGSRQDSELGSRLGNTSIRDEIRLLAHLSCCMCVYWRSRRPN
jgi:uncharacterized RDD family membrane protein YckC